MKFLYIISTLDRSYGGPVEGVKNVTNKLIELNHNVDILTLDNKIDRRSEFKAKIFNPGHSFLNYKLNFKIIIWLLQNKNSYDYIIVNGVWQFHTLASRIALGKGHYFLYVHGMLDPWFKERYKFKHLKKLIYWFLFERKNLQNSKKVLFTTYNEYLLAAQSFPFFSCNYLITGFGINSLKNDNPSSLININSRLHYLLTLNKRIFLHLGRVDPKKGTDILISVAKEMSLIRDDFIFIIAGPDKLLWSKKIKNKAQSLINKKIVLWCGEIEANEKLFLYNIADAFVLPSHSENFGSVVPEALSCGLPVIISNKVNIYDIIKKSKAGYICSNDHNSLKLKINQFLNLSNSDLNSMKNNASKCFMENFSLGSYIKTIMNL